MQDITESGVTADCKTACALGLFDGVHKGHQRVIETACKYAYEHTEVCSAVFAFKTDTMTSKAHDGRLEMILTDEVKRQHFEQLGVDYVCSPSFEEMKNLPAEAFVRDILVKKLNCVAAVCGQDFRFGKAALGDCKRLAELGEKYGIEVIVAEPLTEKGITVSSTEIRKHIRNGEIEQANEMLGYKFGLYLPVLHGKAIGRTMDFPTINQLIPKGQVLPRFGVYCTTVNVRGKNYCGVTNVGIKPTVHVHTAPLAETYIVGFEGNLYGEKVSISFDRFVRPERKFDGLTELKAQIKSDTQTVIRYYNSRNNLKGTD